MHTLSSTDLLVLGGGPGGYSAAFRAADLGLDVTLVERYPRLGGVCLNVGCIPSKALLHLAGAREEAERLAQLGLADPPCAPDLAAIRRFRDRPVERMTANLAALARERGVSVVQASGTFDDAHHLRLTEAGGRTSSIGFEQLILATGSRPATLPLLPDDPRIWDATDALRLDRLPERLLVIGGGIIGLEMATVYRALGSAVTLVEAADQLVPGADADLLRLFQRHQRQRFDIRTSHRLESLVAGTRSLTASLASTHGGTDTLEVDAVLVAVGRRPNGDRLSANRAGLHVDDQGFVPVDDQLRTNLAQVFAIGDLVGQPMLAHKASHQGKVAAEVAAGRPSRFAPRAIPSIAYTHPEIAWTGLTERQAKAENRAIRTAAFPWSASGRALTCGQETGRTKLIFDADSDALVGAGLVGPGAGELIGELTLALEFGASIEDLALTVHGHPSFNETVGLAAELAHGSITDLPNPAVQAERL